MGHWPGCERPFKDRDPSARGGAPGVRTRAGGDVARADGPVAVAAGAEVAGQLALLLLKGAWGTQHAALLLAVVVRARRASD